MRKTGVLSILFLVVLLAAAVIAAAQQPTKVPRIGYLAAASRSANVARYDAMRLRLNQVTRPFFPDVCANVALTQWVYFSDPCEK
jgi:hypothetical protein